MSGSFSSFRQGRLTLLTHNGTLIQLVSPMCWRSSTFLKTSRHLPEIAQISSVANARGPKTIPPSKDNYAGLSSSRPASRSSSSRSSPSKSRLSPLGSSAALRRSLKSGGGVEASSRFAKTSANPSGKDGDRRSYTTPRDVINRRQSGPSPLAPPAAVEQSDFSREFRNPTVSRAMLIAPMCSHPIRSLLLEGSENAVQLSRITPLFRASRW